VVAKVAAEEAEDNIDGTLGFLEKDFEREVL